MSEVCKCTVKKFMRSSTWRSGPEVRCTSHPSATLLVENGGVPLEDTIGFSSE